MARNLRTLTGMEMDTWYDLRIEQLFDLTGRVNELLDEVEDSSEGVAAPARQGCGLFDLTGRASDVLKEVEGDK